MELPPFAGRRLQEKYEGTVTDGKSTSQLPEEPHVLRQAMWRSAIVHSIKCFGQSESRFSLDPKKIYKCDTGAFKPYEYFESLRNKHLVHDENSYAQCLPGAVLNKKGMDRKIAKIVCLSVIGHTLSQDNYSLLAFARHARTRMGRRAIR